ncbi:MAG: hypothetical protein QOE27_1474, partial [Solirubrobacteraceae bacterium]|nr:hypothetical protein [Solirubrobacteraceae bacterium]
MFRTDRCRPWLAHRSGPRVRVPAILVVTCISLFGPAGSASAAVSPSSTAVGCSPASVHPGQATTCTVTVTGSVRPTGTVAFAGNSSGTFSPTTCTLAPIGGTQARCSVSYTPASVGSGVHKVYASYSGDASSAPSTGSTTVNVQSSASAVTVTCSPGSLQVGQPTTCTATVTGSTRPTGTVTFASNSSGTFNSTTCTLVLIGGNQARCSVVYTPSSTGSAIHKIYASYSGDVSNSRATALGADVSVFATPCPAADNGRTGSGPFRFITSACENPSHTVATFPLHRGMSHGRTVWFVVTDSSVQADALAQGVNFAPKLANAIGSSAIQVVTVNNGVVNFPATVDFAHTRRVTPGPTVFPPAVADPPAVGEANYSPLIQLPDGTVLNAPQVANDTGKADKVVSLDTTHMAVQYRETEGFYEDKFVHYASFDSGSSVAAAIEDMTYAPALNALPRPDDEGLTTSAREELNAFINGPTGVNNPQRQGVNATILDDMDPHNILHETPVLPAHADVGSIEYAPMWDVHFAQWTQAAIDAGDRVQVRSVDEVRARVAEGLITGPGGGPF